jgi:hypothetical protein
MLPAWPDSSPRDRFAAHNGAAQSRSPPGDCKSFRLPVRGNRRLNHAIRIAPRSPRSAYAERFVLTARTEVTDRMLIFGEQHLRLVLAEYAAHNGRRPHRSCELRPPGPDHPVAELPGADQVSARSRRLLSEYEQAA